MAKYTRSFRGDFEEVYNLCADTVMKGSISASLEDESTWTSGNVKVSICVFERYSWLGNNRVSLNLTLVGEGENLFLTAITSGGSTGVFFKINRFGEEAFLDTLVPNVEQYIKERS